MNNIINNSTGPACFISFQCSASVQHPYVPAEACCVLFERPGPWGKVWRIFRNSCG